MEEGAARATRSVLARHRVRVLQAGDLAEVGEELGGIDSDSVERSARESQLLLVRLDGLPERASPLLQQRLFALGGLATPPRELSARPGTAAVVLAATPGQFERLISRLDQEPFDLGALGRALGAALGNYARRAPRVVQGPHRSVTLGDRPRTMGVVNVTPDSFSDGGMYFAPADAVAHAEALVAEGADVIDVGAESTRPGAAELSPEREWERLAPVLAALHDMLDVPLSVDTRHAEVARRAVEAGADWLNDVGGLRDPAMRRVVADSEVAVVVMHMRGEPATMQADTSYSDVRGEVYGALADATTQALAEGIGPERLLVDPGLGFGKSAAQSLELLNHVGEFRSLGYPVVVGASRKSFLAGPAGAGTAGDRLEASVAAAVIAAIRGAELVRVHDVRATVRALAVVDAARRAGHRTAGGSPS